MKIDGIHVILHAIESETISSFMKVKIIQLIKYVFFNQDICVNKANIK